MIITYDEHGGFFDHVSPEKIRTNPRSSINYSPFESVGIRVPAIVISPFVNPGQPFHGLLDHTSILKFMGQLFGGGSYTKEVDERPVGSIYDVLDSTGSSSDAPAPPNLVGYLSRATASVGYTPGKQPYNENAQSFQLALNKMHSHSPNKTQAKFGDEVAPFLI
jgi:phospholipase C